MGYLRCWSLKIRCRVSFPSPLTSSSLWILERKAACAKARWSANIPAPGVREGLKHGCLCMQASNEYCRQDALPLSSLRLCGALVRGCRLGKALTRRSRKGGDGGMRKKDRFETLLARELWAGGWQIPAPSSQPFFFCNGMCIWPFPGPR